MMSVQNPSFLPVSAGEPPVHPPRWWSIAQTHRFRLRQRGVMQIITDALLYAILRR